MKKTDIGNEMLSYIEQDNVPVFLLYGAENPDGYAGTYDPFEDRITVYCDVTKTVSETAKTVIHEAMHRKLGSTNSFAEELACYKAEEIHEKGSLTKEDVARIIKHIRENYPNLR